MESHNGLVLKRRQNMFQNVKSHILKISEMVDRENYNNNLYS